MSKLPTPRLLNSAITIAAKVVPPASPLPGTLSPVANSAEKQKEEEKGHVGTSGSDQSPAGTSWPQARSGDCNRRIGGEATSVSGGEELPINRRIPSRWLRRLLHRPPAPQQLDALDGYARWAATYERDMDGHPLALAESGAMLALLPDCIGVTALDAACGTGRYARLLAEHGARRVIGVDQSAEMLERARAIPTPLPTGTPALQSGAIEFRQGTLLALPLPDESCDLAVVALALAHLATVHLEAAFAEFRRVLRPGGILLMSELHPFGALTGGRCRFETGSGTGRQVYHILTHTHLHEDYLAAASAADLTLEALREPRLTPDLVPAFERAGMGDFARQFAGFPLALVCRWRVCSVS